MVQYLPDHYCLRRYLKKKERLQMKKNSFPLVLIVLTLFGGAYLFENGPNLILPGGHDRPAVMGAKLPNIQLETVDGQLMQLQDYRGKVVMVNAFASWCAPCRAEAPYLEEAANQLGSELVVIGLNIDESQPSVEQFRDDFVITYPLVMDPEKEISRVFKPLGLPTSWFIDGDGVLRYVHSGPLSRVMIEEILRTVQ
jgi:thiol-disulfide isomerase/thioredoxin